jgi:hypothetical protein
MGWPRAWVVEQVSFEPQLAKHGVGNARTFAGEQHVSDLAGCHPGGAQTALQGDPVDGDRVGHQAQAPRVHLCAC